ncbi:AEC family transporter [Phormidium sp. FACHB-592]|uniref:AEC family transporter n=1 Tax=Stenomitos frigidus AS-A4 TaxID=2933935 RepID=A0ABV0KPH8_9CYAN|nr:AEC family transporter [Phormidium sp. FACHB-592]MBD2074149.1 AEC family transporter [Phormidium sp. FACHB-592]
MADTLFDAYLPLVLWTGLGLIAFRFVPQALPRLFGRSLYWVGVPWQILALARQTDYAQTLELAPAVTIAALVLGLLLAWVSLQMYQRWLARLPSSDSPQCSQREALPMPLLFMPAGESAIALDTTLPNNLTQTRLNRSQRGSFILAATIGNTGFVGLGLVPALIHPSALGWAVFYSVTHNIIGTYGIGVFLASYYGRSQQQNHWFVQLRDVLTVPSLWAFALGSSTRSVALPEPAEQVLHASLWFVIPGAFLLMGMRLSQLHGWKSIQTALPPTLLKMVILPLAVGLGTTLLRLPGDARLALVLMSGMPSAFAGLILAEEYELDRELIASSIALSTIALLFTIPLWLFFFK